MNPHDFSRLGSLATCGLVIAVGLGGFMYFMGQSSAKTHAKRVRRQAASERQKNLELAKRELVKQRVVAQKDVKRLQAETLQLKLKAERIEARHPELRGGSDDVDLSLFENRSVKLQTVVLNTANALFRKRVPECQGVTVKRGKYGFMLDVRFKDKLKASALSQIERAVGGLRRALPPRWVSNLTFRAKRAGIRRDMHVSMGGLSRIDGRLARVAAGAAFGQGRLKLTRPRRIRTQRDRRRASLMIGGQAGASFSYYGASVGRTTVSGKYQTYRLFPGPYFFAVQHGALYYGVWTTLRGGNVYSVFFRRPSRRRSRPRPRRRRRR